MLFFYSGKVTFVVLTATANASNPAHYRVAPIVTCAAPPQALNAPVSAPTIVGNQLHVQDKFGILNYGYSNSNSVKNEVGSAYGTVNGGKNKN